MASKQIVLSTALAAAVDAGARRGWASDDPEILGDTNNLVVWLRPHEVVVKVGVHAHSRAHLQRELSVCTELLNVGLRAPVPAIGHLVSGDTSGLPISVWVRVPVIDAPAPSAAQLGALMRQAHDGLSKVTADVPPYLDGLRLAAAAIPSIGRRWVRDDDRQLLESVLQEGIATDAGEHDRWRLLHGEPHTGNVLTTRRGLMLIDYETTCFGPVEWDLTSLPESVAPHYGAHDAALLTRLRRLNHARVATWCLLGAENEAMYAHGLHHLNMIRAPGHTGEPEHRSSRGSKER